MSAYPGQPEPGYGGAYPTAYPTAYPPQPYPAQAYPAQAYAPQPAGYPYPPPAYAPAPVAPNVVVVNTGLAPAPVQQTTIIVTEREPNHLAHFCLCFWTLGLWFPCWIGMCQSQGFFNLHSSLCRYL